MEHPGNIWNDKKRLKRLIEILYEDKWRQELKWKLLIVFAPLFLLLLYYLSTKGDEWSYDKFKTEMRSHGMNWNAEIAQKGLFTFATEKFELCYKQGACTAYGFLVMKHDLEAKMEDTYVRLKSCRNGGQNAREHCLALPFINLHGREIQPALIYMPIFYTFRDTCLGQPYNFCIFLSADLLAKEKAEEAKAMLEKGPLSSFYELVIATRISLAQKDEAAALHYLQRSHEAAQIKNQLFLSFELEKKDYESLKKNSKVLSMYKKLAAQRKKYTAHVDAVRKSFHLPPIDIFKF